MYGAGITWNVWTSLLTRVITRITLHYYYCIFVHLQGRDDCSKQAPLICKRVHTSIRLPAECDEPLIKT